VENVLNGSENPYLSKYKYKRKLDSHYFHLVDTKFPEKNVCYFCLTVQTDDDNMICKTYCKEQIEFRISHKLIRDEILARDNYTCQQCGVEEKSLHTALEILRKSNKKLWKLKRAELKIPDKRVGCLLDVDHIIPVTRGGGAGIGGDIRLNLQTLCLYDHFHKDYYLNGPTAKPPKLKTKNRKIL
jgi:5-methylcytosine-specific restriction endonuclease McrA